MPADHFYQHVSVMEERAGGGMRTGGGSPRQCIFIRRKRLHSNDKREDGATAASDG